MDIRVKLQELKVQYDQNQQQINELFDHQKRLEGAYLILLELAKEQGLIDEEGNIVEDIVEDDKKMKHDD